MNDTTPKQAGLTVEQTQVVCRRLAAINYQLEAILTNGGQSPVGSQGIPDNPTDERIILQAIWEETQFLYKLLDAFSSAESNIEAMLHAAQRRPRRPQAKDGGALGPSH